MRKHRWRRRLLVGAFLALLTGCVRGQEGPAYGVVAHLTRPGEYETADQELTLLSAAGVSLVRTAFDWSLVQPQPDTWHFDHLDHVVGLAAASDIEVLGVLAYRVPWAAHPAVDPEPWLAYVRTVVARYHDRVRFWEVWNEPNQEKFWMASPDPTAYAGLLRKTYETIKAVDPGLIVLNGGTARIPHDYLEGLYTAGAAPYFDVMSVHPYRTKQSPESGGLYQDLLSLQTLMNRYGDARKPIWITEIGWPTHRLLQLGMRRRFSEDEQAGLLGRALLVAFQAGAQMVIWYELVAPEDRATDGRDHFGILHRDLQPKPAFHALQALIRARPEGSKVHPGIWHEGGLYYPHWQRPDGALGWALWSISDTTTYQLQWEGPLLEGWDGQGRPVLTGPLAPPLEISLSTAPLFLIGPTSLSLTPAQNP